MPIYRRIHITLSITAISLLLIITFVTHGKKSTKLKKLVDLQQPPPLADLLREAIRFNELIAYTQYSCRTKLKIPEESYAFQLCLDANTGIVINGSSFTFVSVSNSFEDFEFETELFRLSNGSGIILSPKSRDGQDSLLNHPRIKFHSGVLVPSDSADRDDGSRKYLIPSDFANYLTNLDKIDVFKLDCTNCWRLSDNPRLLLELIRLKLLDKVKQLHLVVRLEDKSQHLTYLWYSLLHTLYYESGFALYSAAQLGECGRTVIHCQYKLSFVKSPEDGTANILTPIAGMGFPEEEVSRLLCFINDQPKSYVNCNEYSLQIGNKYWPSCPLHKDLSQNPCTIYYFTLNAQNSFLNNTINSEQCQLILFDPTLNSEQNDNFHLVSETLADKKFGNLTAGLHGTKSNWALTTLTDVVKKLNQRNVDLLILDLNGGEWDAFEEILSQRLIKVFRQIIIKLRIWYGEENDNYRQIYSWLIRMKKAGWKISDSSYALHDRNHRSYDSNCVRNSCYLINFSHLF